MTKRRRATERPASFKWHANRDAVALLLAAFGYPTIPPEPPQSGSRRVHTASTENDDEEEA